ncbi:MAG: DUF4258 domain-containing protein [Candidatus Pacearchaeota archaeon]|jgi:hypothetical protein
MIIITDHAKKRMVERDISFEIIKIAVEMPDYTVDKDGMIEAFKKLDNKTLKVVYVSKDKFIKILSVMWK